MRTCTICGKECKGVCCSGACRAKLFRRTRTVKAHAHAERTRRPVAQDDPLPQDADTALTTQNTDEQEDGGELKSDKVMESIARIDPALKGKFIGLDEPILITDVTPEDQAALFDTMPPEPTRPTGHTTPATAKMTAQQLKTRLSLYHGLDWINSPEYAETIYRLLTSTLDELKGQSIPAWRQNAA